MVTMTATAASNLQCIAVHTPSGVVLKTDAPIDVGGEASSFSPTDLVSVGLLTCILTTMGLVANKIGVDLTGATGSVEKIMTETKPRRIAKLVTHLTLPVVVNDEQREKLEHAAHHCPVHHSLHPDIAKEIVFSWQA
jgi:putative redox protein